MAQVRKAPQGDLKGSLRSKKLREEPAARPSRIVDAALSWLPKHSFGVFILLVALGSLRIVSTYHVFSQTSDEPAHIAAGLEWLSKGVYHYETQHPPLARVATALGPYLSGLRSSDTPSMWKEGLRILYDDGHGDRNLALARLGILPFFWVACFVVYLWGKRYLGEPATALSVLCFTFLPPVLAHAGLATTDMALTAMVSASFLAAMIWLDRPSAVHTLILGGTTALAVLSKFSSLPFIPAALGAALTWYLIAERPGVARLAGARRYILPFCGAVLVGLIVIWAGYRFSFGPIPPLPRDLQPVEVTEGLRPIPPSPPLSFRVPAPELFSGIQEVMAHNDKGSGAYLLGHHSDSGWWYYYLIALAVKTPLPFLALLVCGVFVSNRRGPGLALGFSLGILAFASWFSHINIGLRHVLPVYVGFAIVAGAGAGRLLEYAQSSRLARWILGVLLLWLVATSTLSHPDYLAYFNGLVGDTPEKFLLDSDLDWGQDVKRLAARLHELGASEVAFAPYFLIDPEAQGLPPVHDLDPEKPSPGWNAVGLTALKAWRFGHWGDEPDLKFWPDQIKPTEKVGKSIWLWYFPPNAIPKGSEVR